MEMQDNCVDLYKVLLVEDDLVDVELVRRQLHQIRRPRFELSAATYLSEALQLVTETSFDAILLDLNLPDSVGLDSVDQLKSVWKSGPIIVLTGLEEECLGVDAIRHGVEDYLVKDGLSANLLSRTIRYGIERHRMACWLKATGRSKDEYLADICDNLRENLSELLMATSVLVGNDDRLDSREMEQIERIMACGKRMSKLIDDASPAAPTEVATLQL